jgi:hypothetical protein
MAYKVKKDVGGGAWTGLIWLTTYKCGNESSGSIKCGEFLD